MKIYTTLSALKAVNLLSADKDVRYYLMGVRVTATATATRLTATDGYALAFLRDVDWTDIAKHMIDAYSEENYGIVD